MASEEGSRLDLPTLNDVRTFRTTLLTTCSEKGLVAEEHVLRWLDACENSQEVFKQGNIFLSMEKESQTHGDRLPDGELPPCTLKEVFMSASETKSLHHVRIPNCAIRSPVDLRSLAQAMKDLKHIRGWTVEGVQRLASDSQAAAEMLDVLKKASHITKLSLLGIWSDESKFSATLSEVAEVVASLPNLHEFHFSLRVAAVSGNAGSVWRLSEPETTAAATGPKEEGYGAICHTLANKAKKLRTLGLSYIPSNLIGVTTSFLGNLLQSESCMLQSLSLRHCSIGRGRDGNISLEPLVEGLRENQTLHFLDLYGNPLGEVGVRTVCESLAEHPELVGFDLGMTAPGKDGCAAVADFIGQHSDTLEKVYFSNNLSSIMAVPVMEALKNAKRLLDLSFAGNALRESGEGLAEIVELCPKLVYLDLAHNQLPSDLCLKIVRAVAHNHSLLQFSVDGNIIEQGHVAPASRRVERNRFEVLRSNPQNARAVCDLLNMTAHWSSRKTWIEEMRLRYHWLGWFVSGVVLWLNGLTKFDCYLACLPGCNTKCGMGSYIPPHPRCFSCVGCQWPHFGCACSGPNSCLCFNNINVKGTPCAGECRWLPVLGRCEVHAPECHGGNIHMPACQCTCPACPQLSCRIGRPHLPHVDAPHVPICSCFGGKESGPLCAPAFPCMKREASTTTKETDRSCCGCINPPRDIDGNIEWKSWCCPCLPDDDSSSDHPDKKKRKKKKKKSSPAEIICAPCLGCYRGVKEWNRKRGAKRVNLVHFG
eukprot:Rmarinus@m.4548